MSKRVAEAFMKQIILTLTILIISTSCALMDERSYYAEMTADDSSLWVPNRDFPVVSGDNGRISRTYQDILSRSPAGLGGNEFNKYDEAIRIELANLENKLTDEEFDQYARLRHKFETDSERIYYLKLPIQERFNYLASKGFYDRTQDISRRYIRSYEPEPIATLPTRVPAGEWMPREDDKSLSEY